jgi:predicted DNA-binding transcriptional regulator YafY
MANTNTRLWRLEKLSADLKQDSLQTMKQLAKLHDVSERTIARDIQLLREQGVPIDADRGKGGGTRVNRNWRVGRLNLNYTEAVELLVSIAIAEQMGSSLFLSTLSSVQRQLLASLSPDKRQKVSNLKSRILIGQTASPNVQSGITSVNAHVQQELHLSFVETTCLAIEYRADNGEITSRVIEPNYLLLNYPSWYVLAFDQLRNAPRTFRCDRIISVQTSQTKFTLRGKDYFEKILQWHQSLK